MVESFWLLFAWRAPGTENKGASIPSPSGIPGVCPTLLLPLPSTVSFPPFHFSLSKYFLNLGVPAAPLGTRGHRVGRKLASEEDDRLPEKSAMARSVTSDLLREAKGTQGTCLHAVMC